MLMDRDCREILEREEYRVSFEIGALPLVYSATKVLIANPHVVV